MNKNFLLKLIQNKIAESAIGPSSLRNQGAKKVVSTSRKLLKKIDLNSFKGISQNQFYILLDDTTGWFKKQLPMGAKNWGAARKALNLFLRDAIYNRYLCSAFNLSKLEKWLEVPLDKDVSTSLLEEPEGKNLPRMKSIKSLDQKLSNEYQEAAQKVAKRLRTSRVHLDLIYWRKK